MSKKLIAVVGILAVGSALAQECILKEKTTAKETGTVALIKNVNAEVVPWGKGQQKCIASLDGYANNQWNHATGEFIWDGDYTPAKACGAAVELAKKNLLTGLNSSIIVSESVVVCKEQEEKDKPLINPKVGTILDDVNRLRPNPKFPRAFYHNGEECRWYLETGWNGKNIRQFNGIVCRYGPAQWIIVDKF
jgi:hypothetical protein